MNLRDAITSPSKTIIPTALLRESRLPHRRGRLAKVAIHLLTEAQHKAGARSFFGRQIVLERGEAIVTYREIANAIDRKMKAETAKKLLMDVVAEAGWTAETVTTDSSRVTEGCTQGVTPGGKGGCARGGYLGVVITISNYNALQKIGGQVGGKVWVHPGGNPRGSGRGGHPISGSPTSDLPTSVDLHPPKPPQSPQETGEDGGSRTAVDLRARLDDETRKGRRGLALGVIRNMAAAGNAEAAQLLREEGEKR